MNSVIVPIVAIICGTIIAIKQMRIKQANNAAYDKEIGDSDALKLEIVALKKRIEALETIVTDKNYNLKQEIDQL